MDRRASEAVGRKQPAILGGKPAIVDALGIVRPLFPELSAVADPISEILANGHLTNHPKYVPELERRLASYLGLPHCVAVANGTLGLVLALRGLELRGEIIMPSFTYSATAHAARWAGLDPVFVDIRPDTLNIDPDAVESAINPQTSAVLAVHVYGNPCDIDDLAAIAKKHGLALLFDAAHAIGAAYRGRRVGSFGDAEVFSFHATKILPMGEGGAVTTSNDKLAHYVALGRNFGNAGDENTTFSGINAKMQEINAILGIHNLRLLNRYIENRTRYAAYLQDRLSRLPGLRFQGSRSDVAPNHQNFAILVDEREFGVSRDTLAAALVAENVVARKYFHPPLHLHTAYAGNENVRRMGLEVTERTADSVLCLPIYSEMTQDMLDGICIAIETVHEFASQLKSHVK